jgi:hypothetical protein
VNVLICHEIGVNLLDGEKNLARPERPKGLVSLAFRLWLGEAGDVFTEELLVDLVESETMLIIGDESGPKSILDELELLKPRGPL